MCAYHRLIYHTPTDCPTMPTTTITTTTTNSNSITCCDSFTFYETCAIPTIYPLSISSLFIFCNPCFLLSYLFIFCLPLILFSYLSLGSFRGSVGRAIGC